MATLSVLVVEDDAAKRDRLVECIRAGARTIEVNIVVAESANGARKELQERPFDLLILDVALPRFDRERPLPDTGLLLLREITESDLYKRPRYILGVTAHEEISVTAQREFHERLWRMLYCDPASEGWLNAIAKFVGHIAGAAADASHRRHLVDVCVVTALHTPEYEAVLDIPWGWKPALPLDERTFFSSGVARSSNQQVTIAAASALRMGMVPATILVSKLVQHLRPRVVLMAGICAGIGGKAAFGDVIVGTDCWAWESGKHVEGKDGRVFEPEPVSFTADDEIVARFQQIQGDRKLLDAIRASWKGNQPATALNVHLGPIATGSPVVAKSDVVEKIRATNRRTVGIDMEAYAVLGAAGAYGDPRPKSGIVKSVCDFADSGKDDNWRTYAAYTSAKTIQVWVERFAKEFVK
jgi:nucleoside phosphorylase